MSHRISILKNFIDQVDIETGINTLVEYESNNFLKIFKDNPKVLVAPETKIVNSLLKKYSDLVIQKHKELNGFLVPLYTTDGFLSLWKPTSYSGVHVDSHTGYEFLQFATVIYLNDNYEGGEIFFPNQNFSYKPKSGDAVVFPCGGSEYMHGVSEVISGDRYTIAMWHTGDARHASTTFHSDIIDKINEEF